MFPHPTIAEALADEHRRDLTARAETRRLARAARSSRPAPGAHAADPADIIRQLVTALRRTARRAPLRKVPAAPLQPIFLTRPDPSRHPQETSCLTPAPNTSSHPPLPVPARPRLR